MKVLRAALIVLGAVFCPVLAAESDASRPWLNGVATPTELAGIHTVRAEADVEVSDGTSFSTTVVYHDPQRAVFRSKHADRTTTMGIEGKYAWTFDGTVEKEGDPFVREFVLGHQFHAEILFFDRFYPDHEEPRQTTLEDRPCNVVSSGDEDSLRALYYDPAGLPLGMRMHHGPEMHITIKFSDWREVGGVSLPFLVWIDDGQAQFEYHYTDVRLNEGSLAEFRAPLDRLTDEQALLRLHRVFMDGHLFGRSSGMKEGLAESVIIVNRGEVHPISGDETLQTLKEILARTDYTVYDDLIRPVVRVSNDGTLGWVIVQVAAGGVQLDEEGKPAGPLEFVSAWVELYEKVDGSWRMNGNVSNFRS
jgi:hypothetical protein